MSRVAKWTERQKAVLTELWPDRTITVPAICERLGVSRNAAYAMADNLDLPNRYAEREKAKAT